jgi:hypothetical protein
MMHLLRQTAYPTESYAKRGYHPSPRLFLCTYCCKLDTSGQTFNQKDYPVITDIPDAVTNPDQYGAYLYYKIWSSELARITPIERFEDKIFDLSIAGFNGSYSIKDFYPVQQMDGTISAPVLYQNFQRTWEERQVINQVSVKNSFAEAVAGTLSHDYFYNQAKVQYLQNTEKSIDVVVFGHTHMPDLRNIDNKIYANCGTWIDHNTIYPEVSRTFAVITTGDVNSAAIYQYMTDGSISDISDKVSKE